MSKFLFLPSLLALIALAAPTVSAEQTPIILACIGDSITKANDHAYPNHVGTLLGDSWEVHGFGKNGASILNQGSRPYIKGRAYPKTLELNPDVVVIMMGTNDSKDDHWVHKEDFVPTYIEFVKAYQALESKPKIYLCYPPPAFSRRWKINDETITNEVIPMIDQVAKATNAQIININAALANRSDLFPEDGIHPSPEGSQLIAETVAAALGKSGKAEQTGDKASNKEETATPAP